MSKKAQNVIVVSERKTVPMFTVFGVELPARVWRETAVALRYLHEGRVDDVLAFKQGSSIKVKPLTITKKPIR